jgi:hypothetical protein
MINNDKQQQPAMSNLVPAGFTSSSYDGVSVKHMYTNPKTKRVVLYNQNEAAYDNLLSCQTGVSNIDNVCMCPGSSNSVPFNGEQNILGRLFTPEQPNMFPDPTQAMRCLIAERRPLNPNSPYEPYLGSCDK